MLHILFHCWIILRFTQVGKRIYAIGGSPDISNLFRIKVGKIQIILYTISGFLVGIATIVFISLSGVGNPYHGTNLPFLILSGVILGGISIMSVGTGSVWGTVIGLLIINTLFNGLSVSNVPSFYIRIIQGLLLILVVVLYEFRSRNKKKYSN